MRSDPSSMPYGVLTGLTHQADHSVQMLHRGGPGAPSRSAAAGRVFADRDDVVLSIVMPAFNEARTIRHAVQHVLDQQYPCDIELIVVDDGSTDGTGSLLAEIEDDRLVVARHPRNFGKGAALMTGIALAKGTHLVPFDADLEYSAADLPRLLAPVIAGRCEVVYGTRLFGANTVYHSFRYAIGNKVTTLVTNLLFDSFISDLHTCLKLVPLPLLRGMKLAETGFGLDTEITANVLRHGIRPFEVPISYYARSHSQGKKITWRDGVRCLRVLGRVRAARLFTQVAVVLDDRATTHGAEPTATRSNLSGTGSESETQVIVLPEGEAQVIVLPDSTGMRTRPHTIVVGSAE